jgi:hypothetical protein
MENLDKRLTDLEEKINWLMKEYTSIGEMLKAQLETTLKVQELLVNNISDLADE